MRGWTYRRIKRGKRLYTSKKEIINEEQNADTREITSLGYHLDWGRYWNPDNEETIILETTIIKALEDIQHPAIIDPRNWRLSSTSRQSIGPESNRGRRLKSMSRNHFHGRIPEDYQSKKRYPSKPSKVDFLEWWNQRFNSVQESPIDTRTPIKSKT